MIEYEITRLLIPWKGTLSTSYLVVGSNAIEPTTTYNLKINILPSALSRYLKVLFKNL